jgi:hypothetical protein
MARYTAVGRDLEQPASGGAFSRFEGLGHRVGHRAGLDHRESLANVASPRRIGPLDAQGDPTDTGRTGPREHLPDQGPADTPPLADGATAIDSSGTSEATKPSLGSSGSNRRSQAAPIGCPAESTATTPMSPGRGQPWT